MERAMCNILCNDMQPLRRVTGRRVVQGEAKAAAAKNKQTDVHQSLSQKKRLFKELKKQDHSGMNIAPMLNQLL